MPRRPRITNNPKTACQKREIKQAMDKFDEGRLYNATGKQKITDKKQATAIAYYYAYLNCDGTVRFVNRKSRRKKKKRS